MNSETSGSMARADSPRKRYWSTFFWYMALTACVEAVEGILHHYELPVGLGVVLALMPILPFTVLARTHWRGGAQGGELGRLMCRQHLVFPCLARRSACT